MIFCLAAFCAGVIILHSSGTLLPWFYVFFVIAIVLWRWQRQWAVGLFCLSLGAMYAAHSVLKHQANQLPEYWQGQTIELVGYACSIPVYRSRYQQIEFCAQSMRLNSESYRDGNFRLRLSWTDQDIDWRQYPLKLHAKLKRPYGTANPSVFSFEKYLFYREVVATGRILSHRRDESDALPWMSIIPASISALRRSISDQLNQQFAGLEHIGLIKALLLGDRSSIRSEDNAVLSATGTQHLLAISGLHVGMLMFLLFRLLPRHQLALLGVMGAGFVYIILVGFTPSAQRAWVMCSLAFWVASGQVRARLWWAYWLAMFLVLLLDPLAPLSLGFWYSFIAVAVLLGLASFNYSASSAKDLIKIQCLIFLALMPINHIQLLPQGFGSILANLFAIPWVSILVLPLILLSFVLYALGLDLGDSGLLASNELLHFLVTFLHAIPLESEVQLQMSVWQMMLFFIILLTVLMLRVKALQVFFVLSLMLATTFSRSDLDKGSEVWVMDVGQGLSLLIRHQQNLWVYDLGPSYERFSSAGHVLIPFIKSQYSEQPITGLIISHGDGDHAGGLKEAIKRLQPQNLWLGEPARSGVAGAQQCQRGVSWHSEGLLLEVLFPHSRYEPDSSNNHSCVIRLTINGVRFLLMGDLEGRGERALVDNRSLDLSADVLIAGHHGSNNATSYALLKRVKPSWVVYSTGYLNRFNHPGREVVERVARFNARGLNTAETGAIHFNLDQGVAISQIRNDSRPYWMQ